MRRESKVAAGLCLIGFGLIVSLLTGATMQRAPVGKERKTMVNKSTPILHVKSIEPSLKFWTERFGFKATIQVPERDHIGFVALDNGAVELMYQTYEGMQSDQNPLAKAVDQGPSF